MSQFSRSMGPYCLLTLGVTAFSGGAQGQCPEQWEEGLFAGTTGLAGSIRAAIVHDDGDGPGLFIGGGFSQQVGSYPNTRYASDISKWDGRKWKDLDRGVLGTVRALCVFRGELIAAGEFQTAGAAYTRVNYIARWDGRRWHALGAGTNGVINALTVYGGDLIAGGMFSSADGVPALRIARWDGGQWHAMGSGMEAAVNALGVYQGELIAAGAFLSAGGVPVNRIARWNGTDWAPLGGGVNAEATALLEYDGELVVGGDFSVAGGMAADRIAGWDGATWRALGDGFNAPVKVLYAADGALYAGGDFIAHGNELVWRVARWDGADWRPLGTGVDATVRAMAHFDRDGPGPSPDALYVAGDFYKAGDVNVSRIAGWNGQSWASLANGIETQGIPFVTGLAVFDDGSGPALFAAGDFLRVGGWRANRIAKWDGWSWSPLGSGLNDTTPSYAGVDVAMAVFDDGGGPALYVGGDFDTAGGISANHIARWDGSNWSTLGEGMNHNVGALLVHEGVLIAGGEFSMAGGAPADFVAAWDGTNWRGMNGLISLGEFSEGV